MNVIEIEDKLIETITNLGLFRIVDSLGRKDKPAVLNYPAAFVYLVSEKDLGVKSRPIYETIFDVMVVNKNLRSEKESARDTYSLIDAVRDAINGKALDIPDIENFTCTSREITEYEDGVITYTLEFKTRHYLAVVPA